MMNIEINTSNIEDELLNAIQFDKVTEVNELCEERQKALIGQLLYDNPKLIEEKEEFFTPNLAELLGICMKDVVGSFSSEEFMCALQAHTWIEFESVLQETIDNLINKIILEEDKKTDEEYQLDCKQRAADMRLTSYE